MTEITDLSTTDSSNTSISGESLDGAIANMGRMDNTLQATMGMLARSIRTNVLRWIDGTDSTKRVALDLSGLSTATTRTLTAPNASGTIALTSDLNTLTPAQAYRRGNILGTVSQSVGVPTGALIESNFNGQGRYVRWADGTQECYLTRTYTVTLGTAAGALFTTTPPSPLEAFPAAFSAIPTAFVTISGPVNCWAGQTDAVSLSSWPRAYPLSDASRASATYRFDYYAIGRWF